MVIVRLDGGLGNQLFQYAMGRSVAGRHGTTLRLDIERLKRSSLRSYSLHRFKIAAELATQHERTKVSGQGRGWRSVVRILQHRKPYFKRATVLEKQQFRYDPNLEELQHDVYLVGYWQNPRYFQGIRELLRDELRLKQPLRHPSIDLLEHIQSTRAISLHVRRGDYASDGHIRKIYGICSQAYYARAVAKISQLMPAPHFFVFSDDPDWVRQNLVLDFPTTYVNHNAEGNEHEDFWLMSQCKHHIIANSTFSWWAAWLHDDGHKVVIAPSRWLAVDTYDTGDLIPAHWRQLG